MKQAAEMVAVLLLGRRGVNFCVCDICGFAGRDWISLRNDHGDEPGDRQNPKQDFQSIVHAPRPVWLQGGYTNGLKKILATMRWPIEKTADIAAGG